MAAREQAGLALSRPTTFFPVCMKAAPPRPGSPFAKTCGLRLPALLETASSVMVGQPAPRGAYLRAVKRCKWTCTFGFWWEEQLCFSEPASRVTHRGEGPHPYIHIRLPGTLARAQLGGLEVKVAHTQIIPKTPGYYHLPLVAGSPTFRRPLPSPPLPSPTPAMMRACHLAWWCTCTCPPAPWPFKLTPEAEAL